MEPLTDAQLTNLLEEAWGGPTYWMDRLSQCLKHQEFFKLDIKIRKDPCLTTQDVWVGNIFYFEFLTKEAAEFFAVQLMLIQATL